jgi:DNA-binding NarL/FixJ family response regulator
MTTEIKPKLKILIADDHAVVCKGIEQILNATPDMASGGMAGSGEDVLDKIRNQRCDLVLLDISMPGLSGLALLKQIKKEWPKLPVLMLSVYPEERYAIEFLKCGASGYLAKTSAPDLLTDVIRRVANGETYIGPALAQRVALDLIQANIPAHQNLSDREFQVLCMIGSGKGVSEIGREIGLSVKTISTHRTHILKKMNMKSNAQLTNYCIKNFLVD